MLYRKLVLFITLTVVLVSSMIATSNNLTTLNTVSPDNGKVDEAYETNVSNSNNQIESLSTKPIVTKSSSFRTDVGFRSLFTIKPEATTIKYCEDSFEIVNVQTIPKSDSVFVSWNSTNPFCISKYEINWIKEDDTFEIFKDNTNGTNITIKSLEFCTEYVVNITPVSVRGVQGPTKTIKIETTLEGKKISIEQFNVISYTQHSIHLAWLVKQKCKLIDNYMLSWISSNQTKSKILDPGVEEYIITDLEPCMHFELMLSINDKNSTVLATKTITAQTKSEAPGIINMWIEPGHDSLGIFWDKPTEGTTCVLNYLITIYQSKSMKKDNSCSGSEENCRIIDLEKMPIIKTEDANTLSYTIGSLEPCTQYTVSIQARGFENKLGPSTSKTAELIESELPAVENVTVLPYSDKLLISWEPPLNAAECVAKYNVKCKHEEFFFDGTTIETQMLIDSLESCTTYDLLIVPVSKTEELGQSYPTTETTLEQAPGQVANLRGYSDEIGVIKLNWSKPLIASACVFQYFIFNETYSIQQTQLGIKFYGLEACKMYNYSVVAWTKNSIEGAVSAVAVSVKAEIPSEPIFKTKNPGTDFIDLGYFVEQQNGCPLRQAQTVCNISLSGNKTIKDWMVKSGYGKTTDFKETTKFVQIHVGNLSPFTQYLCRTVLINDAGKSQENKRIFQTLQDVPTPPILNETYNSESDSITIFWDPPDKIPGVQSSYLILIEEFEILYSIPKDCSYNLTNTTRVAQSFETNKTINSLLPFRTYIISIKASTMAGASDLSNTIIAQTKPAVSDLVTNLRYTWGNINLSKYNVQTKVTWTRPCFTNGIFKDYKILIYGTRNNYPDDFREDVILNDTDTTYIVEKIRPDYYYKFYVYVNVESVTTKPFSSSIDFLGPSGVPPSTATDLKNILNPTASVARPANQITIQLPNDLFSSTMGDIIYYAVMISGDGMQESPEWDTMNTSVEWPKVSNWFDSQQYNVIYPYQTTQERWCPFPNTDALNQRITFTVGTDSCTSSDKYNFCNGLLRAGTDYRLWIRGFTSNGYRDSYSVSFTTKSLLPTGLIIGLILGILFVGGIFTLFIYLKKKGTSILWSMKLCSMSDQNAHPAAVSVQNFPNHYKTLTQNPNQLQNEYLLLAAASEGIALPTYTAELPHNRIKNRYPDIKPYDATRVKLRVVPDEFSDYINASYIKGFNDDIEYIAAQGPKEGTVGDFWQMVYENEVKQIVMVTQLREKGKLKCYKYFPDDNEPLYCDNGIELICENFEIRRVFIIRNIKLKYNKKEKYIKHLQFLEWPDFGVPSTTDAMLQLCREIRQDQAQHYGTVLVHCSAGVGRTGTVIAIDILAQVVHARKKLDVFGTVLNLRKQRARMVQNDGQYKYIYQCIMDEILYPRVFQDKEEPIYENVQSIRRLSLESEM